MHPPGKVDHMLAIRASQFELSACELTLGGRSCEEAENLAFQPVYRFVGKIDVRPNHGFAVMRLHKTEVILVGDDRDVLHAPVVLKPRRKCSVEPYPARGVMTGSTSPDS